MQGQVRVVIGVDEDVADGFKVVTAAFQELDMSPRKNRRSDRTGFGPDRFRLAFGTVGSRADQSSSVSR
jgi:hypothetical protein